jgi:hypothetical protein
MPSGAGTGPAPAVITCNCLPPNPPAWQFLAHRLLAHSSGPLTVSIIWPFPRKEVSMGQHSTVWHARLTYRYVFLITGVALAAAAGCSNYGKELTFKNGQLFYKTSVTEAEAQKLGEFLTEIKYFDGAAKSVQLNKKDGTYEIRLVVKDGTRLTDELSKAYKELAAAASTRVFANAPVQVHMCDEHLKTLEVIKP